MSDVILTARSRTTHAQLSESSLLDMEGRKEGKEEVEGKGAVARHGIETHLGARAVSDAMQEAPR